MGIFIYIRKSLRDVSPEESFKTHVNNNHSINTPVSVSVIHVSFYKYYITYGLIGRKLLRNKLDSS